MIRVVICVLALFVSGSGCAGEPVSVEIPKAVKDASKSVGKVVIFNKKEQFAAIGCCVYIGNKIAVTAHHVVIGDVSSVKTLWNDGETEIGASVVLSASNPDFAVIRLENEPPAEPVVISDCKTNSLIKSDYCLFACGYDYGVRRRVWPCIPYRTSTRADFTNGMLELHGVARDGDSGGGVFDKDGHLVGVVSYRFGENFGCQRPESVRSLIEAAIKK